MTNRRNRLCVVSLLASYLLATTGIHALHDHSASEHCCTQTPDDREPTHGGACDCDHHGSPLRPAAGEHSCFACRFLAVKSITPVVVTIVQQIEPFRPLRPLPVLAAEVVQADLPLSRGPPRG